MKVLSEKEFLSFSFLDELETVRMVYSYVACESNTVEHLNFASSNFYTLATLEISEHLFGTT